MDKITWSGRITGIQPRIKLTRSYDERTHSYLGYLLRIAGPVDGKESTFSVGLGPSTFERLRPDVGDDVRGLGVVAPETETADLYRVSKVEIVKGTAAGHAVSDPPWPGRGPDLREYRRRGHRRLDARRFEGECRDCKWGCRMAVDIILDKWNPRVRKRRFETFCYGPLSCELYRAGRRRTVPWKGGPAWEEPDWLEEEETSHRHPDE